MIVRKEVSNAALADALQNMDEGDLQNMLRSYQAYLEACEAKQAVEVEKDASNQSAPNLDERDEGWSEFLENIDQHAVETGIKDLAANHDHYLYGTPKRK